MGCIDCPMTGLSSNNSHIVSKPMVTKKARMVIKRAREWFLWTAQARTRVSALKMLVVLVDEDDTCGSV